MMLSNQETIVTLPKRPSQMSDADIDHWLNHASPGSENYDRVLHERYHRQSLHQYRLTRLGILASCLIAFAAVIVSILRP
jgi:hypothetical protein